MWELFRRGSPNFPSSRFVSRLCTTLTWTCVHSQKVVSGIRLCNCFVFTFLDSKYLQTKQLTICYILILFKWKKYLLKHQSSALYALMDPPVTKMLCCVTPSCSSSLLQKSLILNEDIYIWSNSLKHWGRAKMADIFQTTFLKAFYWMKMYKSRLRFHGSLFLGVPALVQIITWRRAGNKPLSEPMMICLLTHICVTRPQWVKDGDVL